MDINENHKIKIYEEENQNRLLGEMLDINENWIIPNPKKIIWKEFCGENHLSEKFMEKYIQYIDFESVCRYQKLSEEFIEKYKNKVDWRNISKYQSLTEEFIEKYKDKVDWYYICSHQIMSEEFMDKMHDYLIIDNVIIKHKKLKEWFIDKYLDDMNIFTLLINQRLKINYIFKLMKKINFKIYSEEEIMRCLLEKQKVNEQFIIEYIDIMDKYSLCWPSIACDQKLSEEFMDKYSDKLEWSYIARHQKFSLEFYNKHIEKFKGAHKHLMLRYNYKIKKWYDVSLEV